MTDPQPRHREDDPRFLRTRRALLDTVVAMVDAEPEQPITITKLVETAGLTRPTFYQHFPDITAALHCAALERIGVVLPPFSDVCSLETIEQTVTQHTLPALIHIDAHRDFYLRVIESAASAAFFEELVQFVRQRMLTEAIDGLSPMASEKLAQLSDVVAGGAMWMVVRWIRGDLHGTPNDLALRIADTARLLYHTQFLPAEGR
jgi:AcrR family transcriptional regulator